MARLVAFTSISLLSMLILIGGQVKAKEGPLKEAFLKIETTDAYGFPGSEKVKEDVRVESLQVNATFKVSSLTSSSRLIQHHFKIADIKSDGVDIEPCDPTPSSLYLYQGKDPKKNGYSMPKPETAPWRRTLKKDEVLILAEPGLSERSVSWKLSLQ